MAGDVGANSHGTTLWTAAVPMSVIGMRRRIVLVSPRWSRALVSDSSHLQPVRFSGQEKRMGSFQLTPEHAAGARICDKVAVLGLQPSHDLVQLRSNTACGQARAPVVPEVDAVPLLGASAIVVGGAVVVLRRRRSRPSTPRQPAS
jgi:hypothetical protein